jgi:hypothetical protein
MELREIMVRAIGIIFVASLCAGVTWLAFAFNNAVDEAAERDHIINLKKTKWFRLNNCVHDGYVASGYNSPTKLYRCGDQVLIWRDIPTE